MTVEIVRWDDPNWVAYMAARPAYVLRELQADFSAPDSCLLLAHDPATPEKIIGCAGFRQAAPGVCATKRVVVTWAHQGRGIGRRLLRALMVEARQQGYHVMRAEVPAGIQALADFYAKLGFTKIAPPLGRSTASGYHFERDLANAVGAEPPDGHAHDRCGS